MNNYKGEATYSGKMVEIKDKKLNCIMSRAWGISHDIMSMLWLWSEAYDAGWMAKGAVMNGVNARNAIAKHIDITIEQGFNLLHMTVAKLSSNLALNYELALIAALEKFQNSADAFSWNLVNTDPEKIMTHLSDAGNGRQEFLEELNRVLATLDEKEGEEK